MKIFGIVSALIIVIGAGVFLATRQPTEPSPSATPVATQQANAISEEITLAEVAEHNSRNDCWIAIEGKVYDVTDFITQHPGGDRILMGCGTDATELYNNRPGSGTAHSQAARQMLPTYYIGDLVQ